MEKAPKKIFRDGNVIFIHDSTKDFPGETITIKVLKEEVYEVMSEGGSVSLSGIEKLPSENFNEISIPGNALLKFIIEEFIKPQKLEKINKMSITDFLI